MLIVMPLCSLFLGEKMEWINCNDEPIPEIPSNRSWALCLVLVKFYSAHERAFYYLVNEIAVYRKKNGWDIDAKYEVLYYIILPDIPQEPFREMAEYLEYHFPDL